MSQKGRFSDDGIDSRFAAFWSQVQSASWQRVMRVLNLLPLSTIHIRVDIPTAKKPSVAQEGARVREGIL